MDAFRQQFPQNDFALLAVVLLLPALGALINGVFGKRLGKPAVRLMALTALGGSFLASVLTFLLLPHVEHGTAPEPLRWTAWQWFSVDLRGTSSIPIDVGFRVDAMTATMMLVVTGVGFLIHLYSTEYMKDDPGYHRFFSYLNLFCFSMLVLIMADNLALLFVGWEGVGMCSYLLIGFWFDHEKNASAGKKAFIVNRIGDFGLLLAMALLLFYCGSLRWEGIASGSSSLLTNVRVWPIGNLPLEGEWLRTHPDSLLRFVVTPLLPERPVTMFASTLVGLAVFLGCAGKSAQVPLYVWLPDAMAGPTPVSALIHAATMVTAGVYLVARMGAVFVLSPAAMATVACAGAITALFAASIGLFQNDLKKVLAYSTVSQLGFMFIGVGVGAFAAGFFHVFTHAFFKACLFLGAGSVIHAMHARIGHHAPGAPGDDTDPAQDMRNMGGLRHWMPLTRWTFLISCCAIAGFPGLSGFWSKDEILWKAFSSSPNGPNIAKEALWQWPSWLGPALYVAGIVAATMTAFYMFRAYFTTFHGNFRGWSIVKGWKDHGNHADHGVDHDGGQHEEPGAGMKGPTPHESAWPMTVPLVVLAAFALFAGFLIAEPIHVAPLAHLLEPIFTHADRYVTARAGSEGMMWLMMAPGFLAFLAGTGAAIYVYWNHQGAPERSFQRQFPRLYSLVYDKWRIDELYDATVVGMVDALADIFTMADKWIIDGILAKVSAALVGAAGTVLRALQTGRTQAYAASMVVGLAGVGWYVVRPHAELSVDDANVRQSGQVVVSVAPGPGYTYRWEGVEAAGSDFSSKRTLPIQLQPGERKNVSVTVRNAFRSETKQTVTVARPDRPSGVPPGVTVVPVRPQAPQLPQQGAQ